MTSSKTEIVPLAAGFQSADDAAWRALVDKALKGGRFDRLVARTADGIEIQPLHTERAAGAGEAGPLPQTGGLARGWVIAQLRTETTPEALSQAIAADVEGGANAITIRLAAPGQSGLPADAKSLEAALAPLPLNRFRISLAPGAAGIVAGKPLQAIAKQRGAETSVASLGIDPLGTLARTGDASLIRADGAGFAAEMPWLATATGTTLLADARPYHEAGASEAQEIAALLSTVVAYLRWCEADGIAPDSALPRIGLAMAVDADIFLGIAKLRATRRLVIRVAEACGAGDQASAMPLAVTTSERMMARRDPWVNMLRVTSAAAAGAIGGADEITVLPYTWALGQPDALASRIARNVGLVLREEAGLGRIADPAGGAFAVEHLTSELCAKAWTIFQAWEAEGGMLAVLKGGRVWADIATVARERMRSIAHRQIELTGVSAYPLLAPDGVTTTPWPVPHQPTSAPSIPALAPHRLAEPFETLRDAADAVSAATGSYPRVFLASLGPVAEHAARSTWITNLLAAGGIEAIATDGFTSSGEVGRAFANSGAKVACICGSDETYGLLAEATAMALKSAGATYVVLAGRPGVEREGRIAAGVDAFVFSGCDVVDALQRLQRALGAPPPG